MRIYSAAFQTGVITIKTNDKLFKELCTLSQKTYSIDPELYGIYNVKRGLRNADGSGVLVGLTKVGEVHGYVLDEGEKQAVDGVLRYRGINVAKLVEACRREKRFGYEEAAYLLLFGQLPTRKILTNSRNISARCAACRRISPRI